MSKKSKRHKSDLVIVKVESLTSLGEPLETPEQSFCNDTLSPADNNNDSSTLTFHRVENESDTLKVFNCKKCKGSFSTRTKLKRHYQKDHWDKKPGTFCGKVSSTATALRKHRIEIHLVENEGPSIACPHCPFRFFTKSKRDVHIRRNHWEAESPKGNDAPAYLAEVKEEPKDPLVVPQGPAAPAEDPLACKKCGITFSNKDELALHHRNVHWNKFPCSLCGKVLRSQSSLKCHKIEVHLAEDEGPYLTCPHCPRRFGSNRRLDDHFRVEHRGPIRCEICGRSFTKNSISYHRKTHRVNVACEICGKVFAPSRIGSHMRTHSPKPEKSCYFCGMTFTLKCHFLMHIRTHTNERPEICPNYSKCRRDFTRVYYLRQHLKWCSFDK